MPVAAPTVPMTCPARLQSQDARIKLLVGKDFWINRGPDQVCSYCGSMEPEDFLAWCERCAESDSKVAVDVADIDGKLFIHRRGIVNALQGAVKFYTMHWPETTDAALIAYRRRVVGKAIEVSVPRLKARGPS